MSSPQQSLPTQPQARLILASQSPRRRELMLRAGYQFEVRAAGPEAETPPLNDELALALVARLALAKAADVSRQHRDAYVLGCDTVAECGGQILGKPRDRQDAKRMLTLLRDQEHLVHSGLCLMHDQRHVVKLLVDTTRLFMDPVAEEQIEEYLDTGQWRGKAGAFGYQDGLDWLHIREGAESTVVGLPMHRLAELLESESS